MKNICSVYDEKAKTFSTPFIAHNEETAIRDFSRAVKDNNLSIAQFPEDYKLYFLGFFNEETGEINSASQPQFLVSAKDCE